VLPDGIEGASGSGRVVFPIRNLFYVVRDLVQDHTSRPLKHSWFQQVVNEYEAEHGEIHLMYRDPRGYLVEPHTGREVPLGTRAVDAYDFPLHLYDKILYCEKKGSHPLFQAYHLAEKYDMAIVCVEGYATRAAKALLSAGSRSRGLSRFSRRSPRKWDCPPRAAKGDRSMFSACASISDKASSGRKMDQSPVNGYVRR